MKTYFLATVAAAALVSLVSLFSYGAHTEKVTRFALGILLVGALVPSACALGEGFFSLIRTLPGDAPVSGADAGYTDTLRQAYTEGVCRALTEKYGVRRQDVEVIAEDFDAHTLCPRRLCVYLHGRAALADSFAMEEYLRPLGAEQTEVRVAIGK